MAKKKTKTVLKNKPDVKPPKAPAKQAGAKPTAKKAVSAPVKPPASRAGKSTANNASSVKPWTAPTRSGGFNARPVKMADPDDVRKTKTPLSPKEVKEYRELLMRKRAEILGDMKSMSNEALSSDSANLSHMPLHMADVGSDHYEQELTLGLVESERKLLTEINDALERIASRSYGVCQATGKPITKTRLQAKPWAKYCIEAARELERTGGQW